MPIRLSDDFYAGVQTAGNNVFKKFNNNSAFSLRFYGKYSKIIKKKSGAV